MCVGHRENVNGIFTLEYRQSKSCITLFKSLRVYVRLTIFHGIFSHLTWMWWIFRGILSVPHNTLMELNNIMWIHIRYKYVGLHWIHFVFSVTSYSKLRNAITIHYRMFHCLQTRNWLFGRYRTFTSSLGYPTTSIVKWYSIVYSNLKQY